MGPMGPMMGGPMGPMRPPYMGGPGGGPGGGMNNSGPNSNQGPPSQSGPTRPLFPSANQAASMKVGFRNLASIYTIYIISSNYKKNV